MANSQGHMKQIVQKPNWSKLSFWVKFRLKKLNKEKRVVGFGSLRTHRHYPPQSPRLPHHKQSNAVMMGRAALKLYF